MALEKFVQEYSYSYYPYFATLWFERVRRKYLLINSVPLTFPGLNLAAANHVFLVEPQRNPMVEDQALDRVHRIEQTKEVTIVRYIVRSTKEEVRLTLMSRSPTPTS